MRHRRERSFLGSILLLLIIAGGVWGCDMPTEPISFETETRIKAPLLNNKTFQFLGGPTSKHVPLIDTTLTDIDSLFSGFDGEQAVRVQRPFTYANTFDADLSSLESLSNSTNDEKVESAPLRITYTNGIPVRLDIRVGVLNDHGESVVTLPTDRDEFTLEAAPKANDGTASRAREGEIVLNLKPQTVRSMARGETLRFDLTGVPQDGGPAVRIRRTDSLRVSFGAEITTSVRVGQ